MHCFAHLSQEVGARLKGPSRPAMDRTVDISAIYQEPLSSKNTF